MLGLMVAFVGIFLGERLDIPILDGVASIIIGIILALTASFLAFECKGLLIGESANLEIRGGIRQLLVEEEGIRGINEVLTMHLGPSDILLNLSIDFVAEFSADAIEATVTKLEIDIKAAFPHIKRIFIEAQSLAGHRQNESLDIETTNSQE
jgi:divalent metal cation (Fe/Co/Zn/Cd) transporter